MSYELQDVLYYGCLAIALADYGFALFGPAWYFRTGIPLIHRHYKRRDLDVHEFSDWIAKRAPHRIFMRPTPDAGIGLREHFGFYLLYSALLHWQLKPAPRNGGWALVGRLKVYAVAFLGAHVLRLVYHGGVDLAPILGLLLGMIVPVLIIMVQKLHIRFLDEIVLDDVTPLG